MLVSEESCSLPYFTNTYAPPSSGMAIQFPQPKKGMGCAGKQDCGCGCSQGMSNYLPLDNPVSSMRLTSSNVVGMGNYLPVQSPVSSMRLTSSNRVGLGDDSVTVTSTAAGPFAGLFASSDVSSWTWEWPVLVIGGYLFIKAFSGGRTVVRKVRRSQKRSAKRRIAEAKAALI